MKLHVVTEQEFIPPDCRANTLLLHACCFILMINVGSNSIRLHIKTGWKRVQLGCIPLTGCKDETQQYKLLLLFLIKKKYNDFYARPQHPKHRRVWRVNKAVPYNDIHAKRWPARCHLQGKFIIQHIIYYNFSIKYYTFTLQMTSRWSR